MIMDKVYFHEPCCVERTLPNELRQSPLLTWWSNGDVTFQHIVRAVSCLAGNELDVTLCVPEPDLAMARALAWYARRGWLKQLTLLSAVDCAAWWSKEAQGVSGRCVSRPSVSGLSMIVFRGDKATVIVSGPLHSVPSGKPRVEQFITYCGHDAQRIAEMTAPIESMLRVKPRRKRQNGGAAT